MRSTMNCRNDRPSKLSPGSILLLIAIAVLVGDASFAQTSSASKAAVSQPAPAKKNAGDQMDLQTFLQQVQAKNGNFRALEASREAAQAKRVAGDAELATSLTAKYTVNESQKPAVFAGMIISSDSEVKEASVGLAKKFSTGTKIELNGVVTETNSVSSMGAGATPSTTNAAIGGLNLSLSQSLWKNFFGKSTDLRRERESLTEQAEIGALDVQQRQVLIKAESAFWDYVYLTEELRQRQDSLERAKSLSNWTRRRVSNGIGDKSDVIGTESLLAGRELALLNTQDSLTAATRGIRDVLELGPNEPIPTLVGRLDGTRQVESMLNGELPSSDTATSGIVSLDAYLSVLQARAQSVGAQEATEATKPDLVLLGAYGTNSIDKDMSGATQDITKTDLPSTMIGISFTYMLDGDIKEASRGQARANALAAKQTQERKLLESRSAWEEMVRRHKEMTERVKLAERSSQLQLQKADAEKDKLSKGRSVTSTVVQAEEDAADGRLTLAKLQTEQRKLESQARMFIRLSEGK